MSRGQNEAIAGAQAWQAAMAAFDLWVVADQKEREILLARLAVDDKNAHAQLVKLIRADAQADDAHFLGGDVIADVASDESENITLRDLVGERIGAWLLQRLLGTGGSGQVWLAQRCDGLHAGMAALKLLRATAIDSHAQKRFAREGRLLARLQHPHIARLLDVGQSAACDAIRGQRYLVLEYVDGERIDRWCDRHNASVEQRLRLFLQVCDAVAYAHANLIVHRDLKPTNILVQAQGQAKLLDFGIAKLLESDTHESGEALEATELTRIGGAPFTPEYAAPEQFERHPATVATDVYSLGVVLYVLLAGRRPYGDEESTPAQLARAVVTGQLRRLSGAMPENTPDSGRVAQDRATTPEQLRRTLRGDLEIILARALKRNPVERYASVQAFADDVQRYLAHQPIVARADSAGYRLRKFVRRNRLGVTIAIVLLLAIGAGIAAVMWQARLARREAQRAEIEAAKSAHIAQFTSHMLAGINPDQARTMDRSLMRALLDAAAADAQRELADQPAVRAAIEETIASSYSSIGELDLASQHWQLALAAAQATADAATRVRLTARYAQLLQTRSQYMEAHTLAEQAVALAASLPADDRDALFAQGQLARSDCLLFRNQACHERYEHLYAIERASLGEDDAETLASLYGLAISENQLGHSREAQKLLAEAIRRSAAKFGDDNSHTLNWVSGLANVNLMLGDYAQNEVLLRKYLPLAERVQGVEHPITVSILYLLGDTLAREARFAEARPLIERAVGLLNKLNGPSNFLTISAETTLVDVLIGVDDLAAAERQVRALLERTEAMPHQSDDDYGASIRVQLAQVLLRQKRYAQAEDELNRVSVAISARAGASHGPQLGDPLVQTYVDLYNAWNRPDLAARWRAKLSTTSASGQKN